MSFGSYYPIKALGEFAEIKGGKRLPAGHRFSKDRTAYRYIRAQDIGGGQIDAPTMFIDNSTFELLKRYRVTTGDICLTIAGNIGDIGYVGEELDGVNLTENAVKLTHLNGVDPIFLMYALQIDEVQAEMKGAAAGAAQPKLGIYKVKEVKVPVPTDISLQYRISSILFTYDDLIATNYRRIALLEESARLLYREWFVKLRFPGYELVKMVNDLPEGWERKPIVDFVTLLSRGITPKYDDLAKGLIINQKCIREGRINLAPARHQSKEVKQDRLVKVGDILINSTGAGTLGRVAQVRGEVTDCTVDTHVTIVRPISAETMGFFGAALQELAPIFETMGRGATNQLELGRADIGAVKLLTPPNQLQVEFHNIVWPIFEQINALVNSCNLLAEARDALLPQTNVRPTGHLSLPCLDAITLKIYLFKNPLLRFSKRH